MRAMDGVVRWDGGVAAGSEAEHLHVLPLRREGGKAGGRRVGAGGWWWDDGMMCDAEGAGTSTGEWM